MTSLPSRFQKPSYRVWAAMKRLSRDRWLSPSEVETIGMALARRASPGRPHWVLKAAIADECDVVGMIDGKPPAYTFEPHYGEVLKAAKKIKATRVAHAEIEFLKTVRSF